MRLVRVRAIITDYKVNATTITADSYEICFVNEFETDAAFTITSTGNDKLILKNLKIKDTVAPFISGNTLLTISGTNITIDGGFFTDNGSGTAIQVNGNVEIKNSTFEKFEKAIVIQNGATVGLKNNSFNNIGWTNIISGAGSKIIKVGKHIAEKDDTKIDYVVGVMDPASEGGGTIEMYKVASEATNSDAINKLAKYTPATCTSPTKTHDEYHLDIDNDGKYEPEKGIDITVKEGECAFVCSNFLEDKASRTTYAYTNLGGSSSDFYPEIPQAYNDLPTVISVMGPMSLPNTVSEADGSTIIVAGYTGATGTTDTTGTGNVTDTIGGPNIDGTGDNGGSGDGNGSGSSGDSSGGGGSGQPKAGSSGDGYTAKAGAACSLVGIMDAAGPINPSTMLGTSRATTAIPFIFSLLGLVPIAWRRIKNN